MYVDHLDQKCIVYLNTYAYNSKIFLKFVSFCKQQSRCKKQFENSIQKKLTDKSIFTFFPPR